MGGVGVLLELTGRYGVEKMYRFFEKIAEIVNFSEFFAGQPDQKRHHNREQARSTAQ